jgi:DNA (cytosine-5)-methyltransferase 1
MIFGSLFAGCGGGDLGLERAGMSCRWQVEIDPMCRRVLGKHWPNVPRFLNVNDVGRHNLEPVDLIIGGFPCQPFSTASSGKRTGKKDNRWLWPQMSRVVEEIRPNWVVAENVVGIANMALGQVVSDLEALNYEVAPPLEIPACSVGADHWRARYWIIGHTDSNGKSSSTIDAETPRMPGDHSGTGDMGGADGIPGRMDRLRMIGNAMHVDVVTVIGRAIIEAHNG